MTNMKPTVAYMLKRGGALALALGLVVVGTANWCPAQTPGPDDRPRPGRRGPGPRHGGDRPRRGPGCRKDGRPCGPLCRPDLADQVLRLLPADEGPLREGEEAELLEFAQQHVPRIHRALRRLARRDPERYQAALERHAPRLRHMRRVFELSPRMGEILKSHAANAFKIGRTMRVLGRPSAGAALRERAELALRAALSESVRLEAEGLEVLADVLAQEREQRIAERLAYLQSDDVDMGVEPAEVRELVVQWRAADADATAERAQIEKRLVDVLGTMADAEIAVLRQRSEQMAANAIEEVDRRMQELLECATSCPAMSPEPPHGPRGPHGRRRTGERRGPGFGPPGP